MALFYKKVEKVLVSSVTNLFCLFVSGYIGICHDFEKNFWGSLAQTGLKFQPRG